VSAASWAIDPSGNAFDLPALDRALRPERNTVLSNARSYSDPTKPGYTNALGSDNVGGFPTFPSESEARGAGERFLASYPPAGYGSRYSVRPAKGFGWELVTSRAASCD